MPATPGGTPAGHLPTLKGWSGQNEALLDTVIDTGRQAELSCAAGKCDRKALVHACGQRLPVSHAKLNFN